MKLPKSIIIARILQDKPKEKFKTFTLKQLLKLITKSDGDMDNLIFLLKGK